MRWLKYFTVIVPLLFCSLAFAAPFEQISVTSGAAIGFTASMIDTTGGHNQAVAAFCSLETGPIHYIFDGKTTPTSTVGHAMAAGSNFTLYGYGDIKNFQAIADDTTGVLSCSYFYQLSAH